jgi:hypothetical protein
VRGGQTRRLHRGGGAICECVGVGGQSRARRVRVITPTSTRRMRERHKAPGHSNSARYGDWPASNSSSVAPPEIIPGDRHRDHLPRCAEQPSRSHHRRRGEPGRPSALPVNRCRGSHPWEPPTRWTRAENSTLVLVRREVKPLPTIVELLRRT